MSMPLEVCHRHLRTLGIPASALPKPHPPRVPAWTFLFPPSPMWLWTLGRIRHQQEEESYVN